MKKLMSIIAVTLCALMITVSGVIAKGETKSSTDCECCKNCKDDTCKDLCKQWKNMTADAQKSDAGKKVKDECAKICKEKKCCSSSDKSSGTCSGMDGKGCCKK
jgi:hypothetical protein